MKVIKILIIVLLLAILIAGAYLLYTRLAPMVQNNQLSAQPAATAPQSADGTEGTEPPKTPAPGFKVFDIDGKEVSLSDFQGKPVVMNLWATWCGFCKKEMPDFQKKYEEYGDDIHFLMINITDGIQETVEKASSYIENQGFTFPVYYDVNFEVASAYRVSGLPVTYFIDAEGNYVAQGNGALTADILQSGIDLLLEEK